MTRFYSACVLIVVFSLGLGAVALAETGVASWYQYGSRTANGERFRPDGISCAHRRHKFGTLLRVTDLRTGRSIVCRCNDRGPFVRGRIIDLSRGAARRLGILVRGTARVRVTVLH